MTKPVGNNTLLVNKIDCGTIIDHIPAGRAVNIIDFLLPASAKNELIVGLNLSSNKMTLKDIIKIHNIELTEEEASKVAIFASMATISIIKDSQLLKKFKVKIPDSITLPSLKCMNPTCITNHEPMSASFKVIKKKDAIKLCCKYCEKTFSQNEINALRAQ